MKTFIHIGGPKTATTFLQDLYYPHHPEILYIPHVSQWNRWVWCLDNHRRTTNQKIALICEEGITGQSHKRESILRNISHIFKEPRIILTTRLPNESLFRSIYSQAIRGGSKESPEEFFRDNMHFWRQVYNIQSIYDQCVDLFGKENIFLLPYELLRDDKDAFLRRLEAILGISLFESVERRGVNSSLTKNQILFYRTFGTMIDFLLRFRPNKDMPLLSARVELSLKRKVSKFSEFGGALLSKFTKATDFDFESLVGSVDCYVNTMDSLPVFQPYLNRYKGLSQSISEKSGVKL